MDSVPVVDVRALRDMFALHVRAPWVIPMPHDTTMPPSDADALDDASDTAVAAAASTSTAASEHALRRTTCPPDWRWSTLRDRECELGARGVQFYIMTDARDAAAVHAAKYLFTHFDKDVRGMYDVALMPSPPPSFARQIGGPIAATRISVSAPPPEWDWTSGELPPPPRLHPRLWQPGPLCAILMTRLREWLPRGRLRVLDAGSGSGRNAMALAMADDDVEVHCVDNRRAMIEKAVKFAWRMGLSECVHGYIADAADVAATRADPREHAVHEGRPAADGISSRPRVHPPSSLCECVLPAGTSCICHRMHTHTYTHAEAAREMPAAFDVVMYLRFPPACGLAAIAAHATRRPAVLAVETFHTSTPHPTQRDQQIEVGEVHALVQAACPDDDVEVLLEALSACEDSRPMLQVVVRVTARV